MTGTRYPAASALEDQVEHTEIVTFTDEGLLRATYAWGSLSSVIVHNLPTGAKLFGHLHPMSFAFIPDEDRPYVDPDWRDQRCRRFWSISTGRLEETCRRSRISGYEVLRSYTSDFVPSSIALEPNT